MGTATSVMNLLLLFLCLGSILVSLLRVPHIKVYRMSLIIILISYFMLILCYLMFMGRLPDADDKVLEGNGCCYL